MYHHYLIHIELQKKFDILSIHSFHYNSILSMYSICVLMISTILNNVENVPIILIESTIKYPNII